MFKGLLTDLLSADKGGIGGLFFGNSGAYSSVVDALKAVNDITTFSFTGDVESNKKLLNSARIRLSALNDACSTYCAKRKDAKTKNGQARLHKVMELQKYAQSDLEGITQFNENLPKISKDQQAKLSWNELFSRFRREIVVVDDDLYDESKHKTLGAASKKGDNVSRVIGNGVFSKDVSGTYAKSYETQWWAGVSYSGHDARSKEKENINRNITKRNVATSRVADLIGIGGLVAKSKSVTVIDKKSGNSIDGNMMDFASGDVGRKAAAETEESVVENAGDDVYARHQLAQGSVSANLQKQLTSLQVLDYLCGQNDRHSENFMIQRNAAGQLDSITGIDNDMSFGTGVNFANDLAEGDVQIGSSKMRVVVDAAGHLALPAMDRTLAENILALKPDELRYALADLIEADTTEAAVDRLVMLQSAIRNEMSQETGKLVKDGEWGQTTHDRLMGGNVLLQNKIYPLMMQGAQGNDARFFNPDVLYSAGNAIDINRAVAGHNYYSDLFMSLVGVSQDGMGTTSHYFTKADFKAEKAAERKGREAAIAERDQNIAADLARFKQSGASQASETPQDVATQPSGAYNMNFSGPGMGGAANYTVMAFDDPSPV